MLTSRDAEIVAWLGCIGAAGEIHVRERFGMSSTTAYRRLAVLRSDGLLEHRAVLCGWPGVFSATAEGLRWQDLGRAPVFRVSPSGFEHAWRVASAAVVLERALPDGWRVLSERVIRLVEGERGELLASAKVGSVGSRPVLHRPDLAVLSPSGRVSVVEVELSIKAPVRLAAICRGWARARHLDDVYYLAQPGPARAVSRAVQAVRATDKISVLELKDAVAVARTIRDREGARDVVAV